METPKDRHTTAIDMFDQRVDQYVDQFMEVDRYADTLEQLSKAVNQTDAKVLELACGPGNLTSFLHQHNPDWQITATDMSSNMLEYAGKRMPEVNFVPLDMRDLAKLGTTWDAIICGFGLPYPSPKEGEVLIQEASQCLRPGGVLYLSTMEGTERDSGWKGSSSGMGPKIFIQYYEALFLEKIVQQNGFSIVSQARKEYELPLGNPVTDLILITSKNH